MEISEIQALLQNYISGKNSADQNEKFYRLAEDPENETLLKSVLNSLIEKPGRKVCDHRDVDFDGIFQKIITKIIRGGVAQERRGSDPKTDI